MAVGFQGLQGFPRLGVWALTSDLDAEFMTSGLGNAQGSTPLVGHTARIFQTNSICFHSEDSAQRLLHRHPAFCTPIFSNADTQKAEWHDAIRPRPRIPIP